ncbi:zinc finger, CCHC-type containing protein [Tanacetum coccineum]
MFEKPPAVEIYDLVDALHSCNRAPVNPFVKPRNGNEKDSLYQLHTLGNHYDNDYRYKAPTPQVFTIQKGRDNKPKPQANKKVKGKGKADKNKQVVPYQPKPKPYPLKRKENPNKDQAVTTATCWALEEELPFLSRRVRAKIRRKSKTRAAVENLTSPYTPQQNGVSERRNRTLLDMVRSMFNLTTHRYPLGLCLESAVRNLIWYPLRVDKTHNEIWHEQSAEFVSLLKESIEEERNPMKVNKVWIVIDRPPNAKVVRSKWIFKKKTDMDGKVHTYKARLVAKRAALTLWIDYEEKNYSPVAEHRALRKSHSNSSVTK